MSSSDLFPKLATLKYWIEEREKIRLAREDGMPWPWTDDPILQAYRFCNVYREDDAVTVWLRENVWQYSHRPEFVHFTIICRQLNQPSSIWAILKDGWPYVKGLFQGFHCHEVLKNIQYRGGRVFNPAYIVSTNGVPMDKIDYLYAKWREYYPTVMNWHWPDIQLMREAHELLVQLDGISDFMAGQVIADLKHTHWLARAPDWYEWCARGPGSQRGLARIMGFPLTKKFRQQEFVEYLILLRNELNQVLSEPMNLDLQNLQNCLCETDKYLRAKEDGKRPKQSYHRRAAEVSASA